MSYNNDPDEPHCITPEFMQLESGGASSDNTYFSFFYKEINQGQATAYGGNMLPPEDGDASLRGWTNMFYLDGNLIAS